MGLFSGIGKAVGKLAGAVTGGVSGGSQSVAATTSYGINAGDVVLLIPVNDGQKFVVIGRLIYAADFTGGSDTSAVSSSIGGGLIDTIKAVVT